MLETEKVICRIKPHKEMDLGENRIYFGYFYISMMLLWTTPKIVTALNFSTLYTTQMEMNFENISASQTKTNVIIFSASQHQTSVPSSRVSQSIIYVLNVNGSEKPTNVSSLGPLQSPMHVPSFISTQHITNVANIRESQSLTNVLNMNGSQKLKNVSSTGQSQSTSLNMSPSLTEVTSLGLTKTVTYVPSLSAQQTLTNVITFNASQHRKSLQSHSPSDSLTNVPSLISTQPLSIVPSFSASQTQNVAGSLSSSQSLTNGPSFISTQLLSIVPSLSSTQQVTNVPSLSASQTLKVPVSLRSLRNVPSFISTQLLSIVPSLSASQTLKVAASLSSSQSSTDVQSLISTQHLSIVPSLSSTQQVTNVPSLSASQTLKVAASLTSTQSLTNVPSLSASQTLKVPVSLRSLRNVPSFISTQLLSIVPSLSSTQQVTNVPSLSASQTLKVAASLTSTQSLRNVPSLSASQSLTNVINFSAPQYPTSVPSSRLSQSVTYVLNVNGSEKPTNVLISSQSSTDVRSLSSTQQVTNVPSLSASQTLKVAASLTSTQSLTNVPILSASQSLTNVINFSAPQYPTSVPSSRLSQSVKYVLNVNGSEKPTNVLISSQSSTDVRSLSSTQQVTNVPKLSASQTLEVPASLSSSQSLRNVPSLISTQLLSIVPSLSASQTLKVAASLSSTQPVTNVPSLSSSQSLTNVINFSVPQYPTSVPSSRVSQSVTYLLNVNGSEKPTNVLISSQSSTDVRSLSSTQQVTNVPKLSASQTLNVPVSLRSLRIVPSFISTQLLSIVPSLSAPQTLKVAGILSSSQSLTNVPSFISMQLLSIVPSLSGSQTLKVAGSLSSSQSSTDVPSLISTQPLSIIPSLSVAETLKVAVSLTSPQSLINVLSFISTQLLSNVPILSASQSLTNVINFSAPQYPTSFPSSRVSQSVTYVLNVNGSEKPTNVSISSQSPTEVRSLISTQLLSSFPSLSSTQPVTNVPSLSASQTLEVPANLSSSQSLRNITSFISTQLLSIVLSLTASQSLTNVINFSAPQHPTSDPSSRVSQSVTYLLNVNGSEKPRNVSISLESSTDVPSFISTHPLSIIPSLSVAETLKVAASLSSTQLLTNFRNVLETITIFPSFSASQTLTNFSRLLASLPPRYLTYVSTLQQSITFPSISLTQPLTSVLTYSAAPPLISFPSFSSALTTSSFPSITLSGSNKSDAPPVTGEFVLPPVVSPFNLTVGEPFTISKGILNLSTFTSEIKYICEQVSVMNIGPTEQKKALFYQLLSPNDTIFSLPPFLEQNTTLYNQGFYQCNVYVNNGTKVIASSPKLFLSLSDVSWESFEILTEDKKSRLVSLKKALREDIVICNKTKTENSSTPYEISKNLMNVVNDSSVIGEDIKLSSLGTLKETEAHILLNKIHKFQKTGVRIANLRFEPTVWMVQFLQEGETRETKLARCQREEKSAFEKGLVDTFGEGSVIGYYNLDCCLGESVGDVELNGHYNFPPTLVGDEITFDCMYNQDQKVKRVCYMNISSEIPMWSTADLSNCLSVLDLLIRLSKIVICNKTKTENCSTPYEISKSLLNIVKDSSVIRKIAEVKLIAIILSNIVNSSVDVDVSVNVLTIENVLDVVDRLLDLNKIFLGRSEKEDEAPSQILRILDVIPIIFIKNGTLETQIVISKKNIGLCITIYNTEYGLQVIADEYGGTRISINETTDGQVIQNTNITSMYASLTAAENTFPSDKQLVVFSYLFKVTSLFHTKSGIKELLSKGKESQLLSTILAVTLMNYNSKKLRKPITLKFTKNDLMKSKNITRHHCTFWTGDLWSVEGCRITHDEVDTFVCECDHLTNFAILMDVSQSKYNPLSLQIMTWIGCGISLFGLVLTVISHLVFSKIRLQLPSKILVCLCMSLICLLVIFLVGVERTENRIGCQIVSGLIHYFMLTTFFWMAVEGVNLYRSVVKVFNQGSKFRFLVISSSFCWGLPAFIVIMTSTLNPEKLGNKFCVPTGYSFYFGVLLPISAVLLVNFCMLFLLLRSLSKSLNKTARVNSNQKSTLKQAKIAFACSCLLGVTWVFSLFAVGELTELFQWLFTIFNSLQGLFIFIFYTATNQNIQNEWCARRRKTASINDFRLRNDTKRKPSGKANDHLLNELSQCLINRSDSDKNIIPDSCGRKNPCIPMRSFEKECTFGNIQNESHEAETDLENQSVMKISKSLSIAQSTDKDNTETDVCNYGDEADIIIEIHSKGNRNNELTECEEKYNSADEVNIPPKHVINIVYFDSQC